MRVVKLAGETIGIAHGSDGGHTWSALFSDVAEAMKYLRMRSTIKFLKMHHITSVDVMWVEIDNPDFREMVHDVQVKYDEKTGNVRLLVWDIVTPKKGGDEE